MLLLLCLLVLFSRDAEAMFRAPMPSAKRSLFASGGSATPAVSASAASSSAASAQAWSFIRPFGSSAASSSTSAPKAKATASKPANAANTIRAKILRRWQKLKTWTLDNRHLVLHAILYIATAHDTILQTIHNDHGGPKKLYTYITHMKPRLLFSIGALLRALQLCTPLQAVLGPSLGVGVGINICANFAGSYWIKFVALGWTVSRWMWIRLGAERVKGLQVPISVSMGKPSSYFPNWMGADP